MSHTQLLPSTASPGGPLFYYTLMVLIKDLKTEKTRDFLLPLFLPLFFQTNKEYYMSETVKSAQDTMYLSYNCENLQ